MSSQPSQSGPLEFGAAMEIYSPPSGTGPFFCHPHVDEKISAHGAKAGTQDDLIAAKAVVVDVNAPIPAEPPAEAVDQTFIVFQTYWNFTFNIPSPPGYNKLIVYGQLRKSAGGTYWIYNTRDFYRCAGGGIFTRLDIK